MRLILFLSLAFLSAQDFAETLSTRFKNIVENITSSIVSIQAFVKSKRQHPFNDPFFDQFRRFFGDDFFDSFPEKNERLEPSLGTGVIISNDGLIVTNHHVAGVADEIKITFSDGSEEFAKLVGTDSRTDIAVLRVKKKNLSPAQLGDSDALSVGEWVLAIGNPFGLTNTVTAGIVSAKGRSIIGGNQFEDFIQTDAAINPGNSGGPLVNLKGQVVGINTAIFSRSGGYMGIGFAIPSNMVKNVIEQIVKHGKVIRGWLGVSIQRLTKELAESFGYDSTKGALVGQVQPDSPADKAKIKVGDIIVQVDDLQIENPNHLRNVIASKKPGTTVTLKVFRDKNYITIRVKLGELPEMDDESEGSVAPEKDNIDKLGLSVQNLTPDLARQLGTKRKSGVVVTRVRPGSIAQLSGLVPQDIIIEADGEPIDSISKFKTVMTDDRLKRGVRLVVENKGVTRFVFIRVSR